MGLSIIEHKSLVEQIKSNISKVSDLDLVRVMRSRKTDDTLIPIINNEQARRIGSGGKVEPQTVSVDGIPCGFCLGAKEVGMKDSKMTCPICLGSGQSETAFDVNGVQLKPGMEVKAFSRETGYYYSEVGAEGSLNNARAGEPIKTKSFIGTIKHVAKDKGGVYVSIFVNPSNVRAKIHGYRSLKPEHVRVMTRKTTHQKRLERYEEMKSAKRAVRSNRN